MECVSKDLVRKGYDRIAKRYTEARNQFINNRYLERLDRLLKPGSMILDLGCGAGKPIDRFFIDRGHKVIGVDFSKKQIKLAKRNVHQAKYVVKDITDLQKEEYQVDAVVSFYTIIHILRDTHEGLFEKISSFLPKGGLALVTMGSSEWDGIDYFFGFPGLKLYWSHYGPEKNREIIEKAGFEVILDEIDTSGGGRHQVILPRRTGE